MQKLFILTNFNKINFLKIKVKKHKSKKKNLKFIFLKKFQMLNLCSFSHIPLQDL